MSTENHPFLSSNLNFHWVELTPEQALIDIPFSIENCKKRIEKLVEINDDQISYDTTFKVFDEMFSDLSQAWSLFTHLTSVKDSPEQRSAYKKLDPLYVDFSTSIDLDPRLWELFKKAEPIVKKEQLSDAQLMYVDKVILDFKRNGADLDEAGKEEITKINKELSEVTDKYKKNLLDSRVAFEYFVEKGDEHLLEGLPPVALKMLTEKTGGVKYRFTLEAPLYTLVMKYAKSDEIRKKLWEGACSLGYGGEFDNSELALKIIELRDRKAKLLGYKSFADYKTETQMTKTGDNALHFIEDLRDRSYSKFLQENEELKQFKIKCLLKNGDVDVNSEEFKEKCQIYPWERLYYSELLRKEQYDFDEEELRPYFSVDAVMNAVFTITSILYGIKAVEKQTFYRNSPDDPIIEGAHEVYHPDVKYYEVYDKDTDKLIGGFYADWYPRENKRSGAWEKQLVSMSPMKPGNVAAINGNLSKGNPALITRREAQTIFHEFGHLCHFLLSKSPIRSLAGTHVLRDFVEFPSKFLENWTWDRESLDLYAKHFETGEKIPQSLYDKMIAARNYHSASNLMGQLRISKVDMELHHHYDLYSQHYGKKPINEIDAIILQTYRDPNDCKIRSPSLIYNSRHLFASPVGYAANYYSYKCAEVLESDAFTRFKKEGVLNEKLGHEIRDKILSQGGTKHPNDLFRDFMGRDPDPTAFFIRYGLQK